MHVTPAGFLPGYKYGLWATTFYIAQFFLWILLLATGLETLSACFCLSMVSSSSDFYPFESLSIFLLAGLEDIRLAITGTSVFKQKPK